eukprot:1573746-Rhodomonas_salina.1
MTPSARSGREGCCHGVRAGQPNSRTHPARTEREREREREGERQRAARTDLRQPPVDRQPHPYRALRHLVLPLCLLLLRPSPSSASSSSPACLVLRVRALALLLQLCAPLGPLVLRPAPPVTTPHPSSLSRMAEKNGRKRRVGGRGSEEEGEGERRAPGP